MGSAYLSVLFGQKAAAFVSLAESAHHRQQAEKHADRFATALAGAATASTRRRNEKTVIQKGKGRDPHLGLS